MRACSSTRSTRTSWYAPSRPRRRCPLRTKRRGRRRGDTTSGCRWRGWRRSSSEPLEIREPDLDERPHRVLQAVLARQRERLLVARADLVGRDALFQAVVPGQEVVVDLLPGFIGVHFPTTVLPHGV